MPKRDVPEWAYPLYAEYGVSRRVVDFLYMNVPDDVTWHDDPQKTRVQLGTPHQRKRLALLDALMEML
jgi:hypothetical protein